MKKITCPDCGSKIDIDRLRGEEAFREIVRIYKGMAPEASLIAEYVECFRASAHAEMPTKKYLRILREVTGLLREGKFAYSKYTYAVDRELALEAMQKTVDTEKRAFRNHNYWKAIMIGMLKKRGAAEERETDQARAERIRERENQRNEIPERGVPMPPWVKEKIGL